MIKLTKKFLLDKFYNFKISLESFFIALIIFGIPLNLYKNRFYDNSWTVGEWLISYSGGFVRRGLPGAIIHFISSNYGISPIFLIWLVSILSLISLSGLLFHFCNGSFDKSFLLSQLIILAPISEDYFIRKDTFIVFLYGLSLLVLKYFFNKKLSKSICIFCVNFFSIIAILSHESYGIWALPSIIVIFYFFERSKQRSWKHSLIFSLFNLLPSFLTFLLCWIFKGNINQSLSIHQSWQALSHIVPSIVALDQLEPTGAIAAIGYESSRVYSSSLISQTNLFVFWHPGMWLLTIFLSIKFFIGVNKSKNQDAKRFILCSQLIAFLPMFLFVDIGRWIFMWLSSSALLFGFLENIFKVDTLINKGSKLKGYKLLPKIVPGFKSIKNYNNFFLLFGLPHCCWSIGRYLVANPIGFAVKNLIFYFKLIFFS